ncbi:hypothetical protein GYMLUDRAFT_50556 [Collybiopsis luxurians FD-317 M1]|uniref:Unplaced genomic scaffold GYMLUscaffold_116, whole genome shotgun sequence n=1 Tax=Collybiopsis luxurians FD-317 M1 TaxID=944289 RepID=A0A0D0AME1_9AGAR|nr:hypothetical protein GYMLUDRAFT_50556 [Collybiopsis luxurians FD-317 M1]
MSDNYTETVDVSRGITITFEPQLRIISISGNEEDEVFHGPIHWHESHDEIITVREGKLKVTLGSVIKTYTPETGDAFIPRGVPHALESFRGVPCVFTERTNPTNFDTKEIFFRNAVALPGGFSGSSVFQVMQVFYYGDMFPVFPIHSKWLEKAFVIVLGGYIAPLLGYRVKYETLKKA